jgi:carbohydrate-selective porin OprB
MFETYYRWWVFKELMITPDFQLTLGEHLGRDTRASMVAGLRFGFIF